MRHTLIRNFGISFYADAASRLTKRAALTKDYLLTRKADRRFKKLAQDLIWGVSFFNFRRGNKMAFLALR